MPFDYHISPEAGLATIRVFDSLTEADLFGALEALRTDPDYRLDMHRLWDLRAVSEAVLELDQMPEIKAAVAAVSRSGRTAFVVRRTVDEITTQYFRLYVQERSIQVFWSIDEARAWLLET